MHDDRQQIVTYQLPLSGRLWIHSFEVAIGFTAMVSGFVQIVHHQRPVSVSLAIGYLAWVWATGYALSGALVLYGFFAKRPRFESAGLMIFATALFIQALSLFVLPVSLWAIVPSVILLSTLGFASVARVYFIAAQLGGQVFITSTGSDDGSSS